MRREPPRCAGCGTPVELTPVRPGLPLYVDNRVPPGMMVLSAAWLCWTCRGLSIERLLGRRR